MNLQNLPAKMLWSCAGLITLDAPTCTWRLGGFGQLEDMNMRLQAETAVNNTGQAATMLDAFLPAILDRAFKGEL